VRQYAYQADPAGTTEFNVSGQGPWAPDPGKSYLELQLIPSTAAPWTFRAVTSLTLEAVLIP